MYKVFDGRVWIEFSKYEYLVCWLAQYNMKFAGYCNSFLEHTGVNPRDTYYAGIIWPNNKYIGYIIRENRIIDADGHSIYSKSLINDVKNYTYNQAVIDQWRDELRKQKKRPYYNGWRGGIPDSAYPDFRRGPWPYIHSYHSSSWRSIRTTNEKRLCADKEQRPFNRGSRGLNLPDSWDDPMRDWRNDGWKAQKKNRHQWENKVRTKEKHKFGKGVYVVKEPRPWKNLIHSNFDFDTYMEDEAELELNVE